MPERALEAPAARTEALEKRPPAAAVPPARDWRAVVGRSRDSEFFQAMLAEMQARRDADRGDEEPADGPSATPRPTPF